MVKLLVVFATLFRVRERSGVLIVMSTGVQGDSAARSQLCACCGARVDVAWSVLCTRRGVDSFVD